MSVRIDVRPALLEWARARSGIADEDWDRRFPRFEAWLAGEPPPTLKQLEAFANKTHTPLGFLFLDEPPVESVPIPDFRTIGDHGVGDGEMVSADLLDVVYTCQARQEWYRDHQLFNGEDPVPFVGSVTIATPIVEAAATMSAVFNWNAETRAGCRSWSEALTQLRENAEAAGVLVMISGIVGSNTHRKLRPEEFRGFALIDTYAPLIFINGADSKAAQVFTLVHELAHVLLGESALSDLDPVAVRSNSIERWCNQVAAEVLVPSTEFRELFNPAADLRAQLDPLATHFRVSTQVILGRIRESGHLTWGQFLDELAIERARIETIIRDEGTSGGSFYNTKPVQVSKRFAAALVASSLEGQTPYAVAFRLLGLKQASTFDNLAERLKVM